MTAPNADSVRTEDVEIELHELLDWSHDYEYFVDLLREKLTLDDQTDPDNTETERCMVQEYTITGVGRPNCVTFTVQFLIEAPSNAPIDSSWVCEECGKTIIGLTGQSMEHAESCSMHPANEVRP